MRNFFQRAELEKKPPYPKPTPEILEWCDMTAEEYRKFAPYILGKEFGEETKDPAFEYLSLLSDKPDIELTLQRIRFKQLRDLLLEIPTIVTSQEHLSSELQKARDKKQFPRFINIERFAKDIFGHEVSHLKILAIHNIRGFVVLHRLRINKPFAQVIIDIAELKKAVAEGNNLAYIMGMTLAAPTLFDEYNYTKENKLAVKLLQAAQNQGQTLPKIAQDFVDKWDKKS